MSEFSPAGHPEFVEDEEIEQASLANEEVLAALLQDECNVFRATVIDKLAKHDALRQSFSWCIFQYTENDTADSTVSTIGGMRDVLLLLTEGTPSPFNDSCIPTVHIVSNEPYPDEEGKVQWLTFDFTLDPADYAQYAYNAAVLGSLETSDTLQGALFIVDGHGQLCVANLSPFTPLYSIVPGPEDEGNEEVFPFGHFESAYDRLYALKCAKEILAEVINREPDFQSDSDS